MPLDAAQAYDNSLASIGAPPSLDWLAVEKLSVSQAYQRSLESERSKRSIEKIVATFTWAAFGAVLCCPCKGGWLIIDGQHRVEAARRRGIKKVPCIVLPEMSVTQQAAIFLSTNQTRVTVNMYALYHARVVAQEAAALDTKSLCDESGISIPRYPIPIANLKSGQTLALKLMENTAANGTGSARKAIIAVGRALSTKQGGISAVILKAAVMAASENPGKSAEIEAYLSAQQMAHLNAFAGGNGVLELSNLIGRKIKGFAKPAPPPSSIPFPTRDQLMRGR